MKTAVFIVAASCLAGCAAPSAFYIRNQDTGWIYGPLGDKTGATVFIDSPACAWPTYEYANPTADEIAFRKRLDTTIMPEIGFTKADVRTVCKFLEDASRRYYPGGTNIEPIRITLDLKDYFYGSASGGDWQLTALTDYFGLPKEYTTDPRTSPPPVTFTAKAISLSLALQIVARATDLIPRLQEGGVLMTQRHRFQVPQREGAPAKNGP